jgi:hypothetical protein
MSNIRRVRRNNTFQPNSFNNNTGFCPPYAPTLAQRVTCLEEEVSDINVTLSEQTCELNSHECRIRQLECDIRKLECQEVCNPCLPFYNECEPCNPCERPCSPPCDPCPPVCNPCCPPPCPPPCPPVPKRPPIIFDGYCASYRLVYCNGIPAAYWFIAPECGSFAAVYRFSWSPSAERYVYEPVDPNNYSIVYPPSSCDSLHITYLYENIPGYGLGLRPYLYTAQLPTPHTIIGYQYIPITFVNPSSTQWCFVPDNCTPQICYPAPTCTPCPPPCEPCEPCEPQITVYFPPVNPCNPPCVTPCNNCPQQFVSPCNPPCNPPCGQCGPQFNQFNQFNPFPGPCNQGVTGANPPCGNQSFAPFNPCGPCNPCNPCNPPVNPCDPCAIPCSTTSEVICTATGAICTITDVTVINQPLNSTDNASVQWATKIAGSLNEQGNAITVDSNNNVIDIGGYQTNPVSIYNANGTTGKTLANTSGTFDGYITKYTPSGTVLWATRLETTSSDQVTTVDTETDSNNDIIVVGNYANHLKIYNANGAMKLTTASFGAGNNSFIIKYDQFGSRVWDSIIAGDSIAITGVAVDHNNEILVIGSYQDNTVTTSITFFNSDGVTSSTFPSFTATGNRYTFIAKYDISGDLIWKVRITDSVVTSSVIGNAIAIDSANNVAITGKYQGTPQIRDATDAISAVTLAAATPATTGFDAFVIKYNSTGTPLWAAHAGGTASSVNQTGTDITVDISDNIIVTGTYVANPLIFYDSTGVAIGQVTNDGVQNVFIVKYNSTGTIIWINKIGGTGTNYANGIDHTSINEIVIVGSYDSNPLQIYNPTSTIIPVNSLTNTTGILHGYAIKYTVNGIYKWATKTDGTTVNGDIISDVVVDHNNNIEATGRYGTPLINFYNSNSLTISSRTLTNNGTATNDAFTVKYSDYIQTLTLSSAAACTTRYKTIVLGNVLPGSNTLVNITNTTLLDANGNQVTALLFTDPSQSITLLWHDNIWSIISNNGVTLIF